MSRYHINKHGVPAICRAKPGNCPLGSNDEHFGSKEEAQNFADKKNEKTHGLLPGLYDNPKATIEVEKKTKCTVKLPFRRAKTKKDLEYIENHKEFLKNEYEDLTYIERCRTSKRLNSYKTVNKGTFHFSAHRQRRTEGLLKEFGEGNLIGYYEVDHLLDNAKTKKLGYKKQIVELRDNGIIKVYDKKDGRTVTTFIPHRARIEAMMILAGEIPSKPFLAKIIENKKRAKSLGYDD